MIRSTAEIYLPVTFCCFHLGYTEPGTGARMSVPLTQGHGSEPPPAEGARSVCCSCLK